MLLDQDLCFRHLLRLKAEIGCQLHGRVDSELSLAICVLNVHVNSPLLSGKEVEAETTGPQNSRAHESRMVWPKKAISMLTRTCPQNTIVNQLDRRRDDIE